MQSDTGPEFEDRARSIARAIYDPSGVQGAVMHNGREHDSLFVTADQVVTFEFTTSRTKEKALGDARKAGQLAKDVCAISDNRFKTPLAFVVTRDEPTADQRAAAQTASQEVGIHVTILSAASLNKRLIDVEAYIALRLNAPFGSSSFGPRLGSTAGPGPQFIEPCFTELDSGTNRDLNGLIEGAASGRRAVILGDFGIGKSTALFEAFKRLRRAYFKDPASRPVPLHINLGELSGTRSPVEILRRHSEEIGFQYPDQLVAAWRSGGCVLLLDGFDELVPSRWVGGARDLRGVRRQALAAVRRLLEETPKGSGVLMTGRAQYFADVHEVRETLGVQDAEFFRVNEFDIDDILRSVGVSADLVPEWMPTRPLLVGFLASQGLFTKAEGVPQEPSRASWWAQMIHEVARREAQRVTSVTPDSMLRLLARVATMCRASTDPSGSVPVEDMRQAFREVCGYEPDEEGLQVVLRLPGLDSLGQGERQGSGETRAFIDVDLAEAAFGADLCQYIAAPHSAHPLSGAQLSANATTGLAAEVAAALLREDGFDGGVAAAAARLRVEAGIRDFVLLEVARCADTLGAPYKPRDRPTVVEVIVPDLMVSGDGYVAHSLFEDSLFERVVIEKGAHGVPPVSFQRCEISILEGLTEHEFRGVSTETSVGEFLAISATNSLILDLPVPDEVKVALSVLKKVYFQGGSARKESALFRGLPSDLRQLVPDTLKALVSSGYLERTTRRGQDFYAGSPRRRTEVKGFLDSPPPTRFWTHH